MSKTLLPQDHSIPAATTVRVMPDVLKAPTQQVPLLFQLLFGLANVACWLTVLPLSLILIPMQVAALDPAQKFSNLALISGAGALTSLIVNPLAGALSDRTTSRFGRRRPWLVAGALLSSLMLLLLAHATTFLLLLACWTLFHVAINILLAGLTAIMPDQVPLKQRATVSAVLGLSQPLGAVIGTLLVTKDVKTPYVAYTILIGVLLVSVSLFLLVMREKALPKGAIPALAWKNLLTTFWVNPLRFPDFAWAWLTRCLLYLSYFVALGYLLYFMQDVVHYARLFPGRSAALGVTSFQATLTVAIILTSLLGGIFSDRLQRRKVFVVVSSTLIVIAFFILAFLHSWLAIECAAAILGIGFGVYLSVDMALMTQVLPSTAEQGKDMGVINIANTLPQVIGPGVAALLMGLFHSYVMLFLVAALLAILATVLVQNIRGVR